MQMKRNTLKKSPEACVLVGKAARLSTGGQATQRTCARELRKKASSCIAQLHILSFTQHLNKKNAFVFMAKC